ncbi:ABC transporter ATP-binding protein [Enterobacter sp.]|uniref:ABC transporter ATP-binding protein n=1 Tax=Enterobacter sp. TaxID=42895 RepID=UPI00296E40F1|nr:ABC transporter ATP-binding protein [Enterobacter sp.]
MMSSTFVPRTSDIILSVNIRSLMPHPAEPHSGTIHFTVSKGESLAIIGPNGCGKSTLLRAIFDGSTHLNGNITLQGIPMSSVTRQRRAKQIAVLAQNDIPDLRLTLEDYVALGRIPHAQDLPHSDHHVITENAIKETGLLTLRRRSLSALSGGERQRAAIARVLAQTPHLLLLDEPTNHLDPSGRVELLSLVKSKGIAVVAVLHDLPLVENFADRVLILSHGRQVICDKPARALLSKYLYPVFGLTSFTVPHPQTGNALRIFEVPHTA